MHGKASTAKATCQSSRHVRRSRIRGKSRAHRKSRMSSTTLILLLSESVPSLSQSHPQLIREMMESGSTLNLTFCQYSPQTECYIVSEQLLPKLAPSHIFPKEKANPSEQLSDNPLAKNKEKKVRLIYAQQILYLTYIAEYHKFQLTNTKVTKQEWESLKTQDIITIYTNLTQKGYNKLQFVQFYLQIRKKSKLIQRQQLPNDHQIVPVYRIFKKVEDLKKKVKGQLIYLVQPSQTINNIVRNKDKYHKNANLKLQILSNLDGVGIMLKPSFEIVDNKGKNDDS